ncbi:hypothetical protein E2C01_062788 [Portunus trituberculatus]|uniref:Uncharacterized protein n=1 Tax=Portunus trituberculatus TaxID=210409 RepID=A0A5B7HF11_PORTR|nr:hypothetical protein [Portunus trituberculatus]
MSNSCLLLSLSSLANLFSLPSPSHPCCLNHLHCILLLSPYPIQRGLPELWDWKALHTTGQSEARPDPLDEDVPPGILRHLGRLAREGLFTSTQAVVAVIAVR